MWFIGCVAAGGVLGGGCSGAGIDGAPGGSVGYGAASGDGGDIGATGSGASNSLGSGGASGTGAAGGAPSGGSAAAGGAPSGAGGDLGSGGTGGGAPVLGDAQVFLAGDSTVANGNTPCPVGWGKAFDALFDERITVVNGAVGGRSVRTWLYDVQATMDASGECVLGMTGGAPTLQARWQSMLDAMGEGDFLLVQFGINDGDSTCPRHVGTAALRESYRMMAEAALERGSQPVFITPVSAIKCSGSTAVGSRGFVSDVIAEGAALGVPVIDLHARSIALYQELGFCPAGASGVSASTTGALGAFFCDDHTHFDTPGAAEIGKLVAEGLEDAGVTLAEYLL